MLGLMLWLNIRSKKASGVRGRIKLASFFCRQLQVSFEGLVLLGRVFDVWKMWSGVVFIGTW